MRRLIKTLLGILFICIQDPALGQDQSQKGNTLANSFLESVMENDIESVYEALTHDGKADIQIKGISLDSIESFKQGYSRVFNEPFKQLIKSGLQPGCCFQGDSVGWEERMYWSDKKEISVAFRFDEAAKMYTVPSVLYIANKTVPNPSFDCSEASNPIENTICSNVELAQLDQANASIYESAKTFLTGTAFQELKSRQKVFLRKRNACSNNPVCIIKEVQKRNSVLKDQVDREHRHVEPNEIDIKEVGRSLKGDWISESYVSANWGSSASQDYFYDRSKLNIVLDFPNAHFTVSARSLANTQISVYQECSVHEQFVETYKKSLDVSVGNWGSIGGSFDVFGFNGYYFVFEFRDSDNNYCGHIVASGRPQEGYVVYVMRVHGVDLDMRFYSPQQVSDKEPWSMVINLFNSHWGDYNTFAEYTYKYRNDPPKVHPLPNNAFLMTSKN